MMEFLCPDMYYSLEIEVDELDEESMRGDFYEEMMLLMEEEDIWN